ncbi:MULTISPECIES: hypothetical protein [Methylobacteriaceae]|uniref:hypothetical protein n=1 Tax=Methylobacteriaceae TaxID=119045 RepID=UPI002F35088D
MTANAPSSSELESAYERLLPEWKKRRAKADDAISHLFELQADFEETSRNDDNVRSLPGPVRGWLSYVAFLDLESFSPDIWASEPDLRSFGEFGRRVDVSVLISRATTAWFRSGGTSEPDNSRVYTEGKRRYVELTRAGEVLALAVRGH